MDVADIIERTGNAGFAAVEDPVVMLDDRGRWVGRVRTADGDVAVKAVAGAGSLEREVTAARTVESLGVPVARVLADLGGDPHVIVTAWASGVALTSRLPRGAHEVAGGVLARLHAAPCPHPHARWFLDRVPGLLDWWEPHAPAGAGTQVRSRLGELGALSETTPGTWGLFDARPDHLVVSPGGVQLIDVENLASFDPAMDVATCATFDPDLLPGLLAGYTTTPARYRHLGSTIPVWVVVRALAAAHWRVTNGFDTDTVPDLLHVAASVDVTRPVSGDGQLPRR